MTGIRFSRRWPIRHFAPTTDPFDPIKYLPIMPGDLRRAVRHDAA